MLMQKLFATANINAGILSGINRKPVCSDCRKTAASPMDSAWHCVLRAMALSFCCCSVGLHMKQESIETAASS